MINIQTWPQMHDVVRLPSGLVGRIVVINTAGRTYNIHTDDGNIVLSWDEDVEMVRGDAHRLCGDEGKPITIVAGCAQ